MEDPLDGHSGLVFEIEAATSRGTTHVRNEDSHCVDMDNALFAVADGMGGHRDGHMASSVIIAALEAGFDTDAGFEERVNAASAAIKQANDALHLNYLDNPGSDICGSTIVTLVLGEQHGCCLWAGDSRLYLFRDSQHYLLSDDHASSTGALTRAVGAARQLDVDRRVFQIFAGDVFVLCSDGLLKGFNEETLAAILEGEGAALAERLIAKSVAGGSTDDITVIVVSVLTDDG